jgi:hypothetical protein
MSAVAPLSIVIFGPYKSGTTGLFYKIRNSLPWTPRTLFEADAYVPEPDDPACGVLAKIILGVDESPAKTDSYRGFQKKIYLIRDPRDLVISGVLFMIQQEPSIYTQAPRLERILALLRRKEEDPQGVSVSRLFKAVVEESDHHDWGAAVDWLRRQYEWLPEFEKGLQDYCRLRYEDFVDGKLGALESYLGISLRGEAVVDEAHGHVPRTLHYDNWKNWFLEEDIAFFRPLLNPYIRNYGYDPDWELNEHQTVLPEHGS